MRILDMTVHVIPAGWRNLLVLKVIVAEGNDGWAEFTDSNGSERTLLTCIRELKNDVVGVEFRDIGHMVSFLRRKYRQSLPGILWKGIAAIENAALDAVASSMSKSLQSLFSKFELSTSERFPVYWSHCPTTRIRAANHIGRNPIQTFDDLQLLAAEISSNRFQAIKTNLVSLCPEPKVFMPGFSKTLKDFDENLPGNYGLELKRIIEVILDGAPNTGIIVDFNYNVSENQFCKIQDSLMNTPIRWFEIDFDDPIVSNQVLDESLFPVCTGENILGYWNYEKIIKDERVSIISIDLLWNGFSESLLIAEAAIQAGKRIALHNYYGALGNIMATTFFSLIPLSSRELLEFDFDDVPWRDTLLKMPLQFDGGELVHKPGVGWGSQVNEVEVKRRASYLH